MTTPNTIFWYRFTAKITPIIFVLVLLGSSVARGTTSPKVLIENYPNNKVHYKIEVDGQQKPHGRSLEFSETGILKAEHHYVHGIRDGISRLYYTTGELMTEWMYRNGKRHGPSIGYFKNGQVKDKGTYQNDLLEGTVLKYYPDGKIKARMYFEQGQLEDESITYYKNGEIQHIYRYFKGRAWTRKDYSPEGKLLRKQEFNQPPFHP
jgi:antitoxin component YwqK of YwqJK toxin-antitoxin module